MSASNFLNFKLLLCLMGHWDKSHQVQPFLWFKIKISVKKIEHKSGVHGVKNCSAISARKCSFSLLTDSYSPGVIGFCNDRTHWPTRPYLCAGHLVLWPHMWNTAVTIWLGSGTQMTTFPRMGFNPPTFTHTKVHHLSWVTFPGTFGKKIMCPVSDIQLKEGSITFRKYLLLLMEYRGSPGWLA